jgi:hypothetical protein
MSNEDLILIQMKKVYEEDGELFQRLQKILEGESELSLRLIDWFVTNYSKLHKTCYVLNGREFIVNNEYHDEMPSKNLFDPFCRGPRITFTPNAEKYEPLVTTIGQLNFFYWAFKNKVVDYILENHTNITADMNARATSTKKDIKNAANQTKQRRKRKELTVTASKTITKHNVEVTVCFK